MFWYYNVVCVGVYWHAVWISNNDLFLCFLSFLQSKKWTFTSLQVLILVLIRCKILCWFWLCYSFPFKRNFGQVTFIFLFSWINWNNGYLYVLINAWQGRLYHFVRLKSSIRICKNIREILFQSKVITKNVIHVST